MHFGTSGPQGGDIPPVAYQLADHLDAALAAAEDLAAAGRTWVPATAPEGYELAAQMAAERQVIERVRTFEAVLIGRVLKARKRAQLLAHEAGDFAVMTRLFIGGTAPLVDVVEELGDSTRADFETGECRVAYLRQRGVITADAADLPEGRAIVLGGDGFLIAGRIALAPLVEMIVAFLDALEAHYDLWPNETEADDDVPSWGEITEPARDTLAAPAGDDDIALSAPGTQADTMLMCGSRIDIDAPEDAEVDAATVEAADATSRFPVAEATTDIAPKPASERAAPKTSLVERLNALGVPAE
ncbi:MAG: hypothetical protein KDJ18_00275 [Hyphomicrobiaceae bacterium]|nr:hypothetical protein [Hyphomicrobiaceae bacterium]